MCLPSHRPKCAVPRSTDDAASQTKRPFAHDMPHPGRDGFGTVPRDCDADRIRRFGTHGRPSRGRSAGCAWALVVGPDRIARCIHGRATVARTGAGLLESSLSEKRRRNCPELRLGDRPPLPRGGPHDGDLLRPNDNKKLPRRSRIANRQAFHLLQANSLDRPCPMLVTRLRCQARPSRSLSFGPMRRRLSRRARSVTVAWRRHRFV